MQNPKNWAPARWSRYMNIREWNDPNVQTRQVVCENGNGILSEEDGTLRCSRIPSGVCQPDRTMEAGETCLVPEGMTTRVGHEACYNKSLGFSRVHVGAATLRCKGQVTEHRPGEILCRNTTPGDDVML